MKSKYDWSALKTEFVTGDITAAGLAKKHNINPTTLYRHYQIERWSDAKKEYIENVMEKCADNAAYIAAIKLAKEIEIADKLADVLDEAVSDKKQFYRYIVKEKGEGGSSEEERIFGKMDMQSLNNAIKALSSLEEIKRVMYGILSPMEERKLQLSRDNSAETGSSDESETGVVILPEVKEDEQ